MVDRGPCDVSQPGTDVSTRGRREVADRRGSTDYTVDPRAGGGVATRAPRASVGASTYRRSAAGWFGSCHRANSNTRTDWIPPAPRGARTSSHHETERHAYIRRLHTIDYTLCLAARHNDHRAACERVIALGQKGAIDLRRDLAHRRRLSSIGCNVLGN